MRVTCKSCGAQYNLPDGKVQGRKAKVRCKKCSATIVVDGTSIAPAAPGENDFEDEDEATQVMQSPMGAIGDAGQGNPDDWTVNLSDDDQQQMSTDEVVQGWLDGRVTDDAYVWKDGMADWLPVMDIPELAEKVRAAEASRAPAPSAPIAASPFAPGPVAPKAPAPEPSAPKAALPKVATSKSQARPATFDLFGPPRSISRDSTPSARPAAPSPMEPQSSENSVVFSLDALKAAAGQSDSKPADSRASEDLLTLGSLEAPSGLGAPLIEVIPTAAPEPEPIARQASPAAAPLTVQQPPQKKTPPWIWGAIAAVVLLGGFFAGRTIISSQEAEAQAMAEEAARVAAEKARMEAEEKLQKAEAERKKAEEEARLAKEAAEKAAAEQAESDKKPEASTPTPEAAGPAPKPSPRSGPSPKPTPKDSSNDKPSGGGKFNVGAAKSALSSAAARAKSCKKGDGPTGSGKVQVTFAPSGRVTSARVVSGPFGGTSVGGCVARTFRGARVPAFSGSPVTVAKSFSIK